MFLHYKIIFKFFFTVHQLLVQATGHSMHFGWAGVCMWASLRVLLCHACTVWPSWCMQWVVMLWGWEEKKQQQTDRNRTLKKKKKIVQRVRIGWKKGPSKVGFVPPFLSSLSLSQFLLDFSFCLVLASNCQQTKPQARPSSSFTYTPSLWGWNRIWSLKK